MDQKMYEGWVKPIIISLATGAVLIVASLYFNAWATGASLRPPFTLGWIKSILLIPLPLWIVLLLVAGTVGVWFFFRERAKQKSDPISTFEQQSVNETKSAVIENDRADPKAAELRSSVHPIGQPMALPHSQPTSFDDDSLVINSPDQFTLRISKVESGTIRGIQLQIENYRLTSIHQIRVILSSACSFDSRHLAFREAALTGQTFIRPDLIRPSSSGKTILLIWKAPQWAGLVTGENNIVRQLLWPDKDKSEIERWKLSLRVSASDRSTNASEKSAPLTELNTDVVVLWNKAQNEFGLEIPESIQVAPVPNAAFPENGEDGVIRKIVRYIMAGQDQLLAYTTTRENLPGSRFLVARLRPGQEPQYLETSDRDSANVKWNEWYQEWKRKGFGGTSGNGLDGEPPF